MLLQTRHDSSCSSDTSPVRQPLKTSFDFSLTTTYQTENVTLTAVSIRNLRCTSPKVIVKVTILEALLCCPEEGKDIQRKKAEFSQKGVEQGEESSTKRVELDSKGADVISDSGRDTCSIDITQTTQHLEPQGLTRSRSSLSDRTNRGSSSSESLQDDTENLKPAMDLSMHCHRCKRKYILVTAGQFESRSLSFRSDLTLNESHTFHSKTGGPFWVDVTVVEKEDPSVVICKGRSEDLYRQNHAFKTFYLETVKKDHRGSVLIGLKYLPLTQKMTLALIESKDIGALDLDLAVGKCI